MRIHQSLCYLLPKLSFPIKPGSPDITEKLMKVTINTSIRGRVEKCVESIHLQVVNKDMDVNEQERLSNFTLRHILM